MNRQIDADALQAQLPAMALQLLVENAIKHGIASRPGGGGIEIRATLDNDVLRLQVDNPLGGANEPTHGHGVGLAYLRAQLGTQGFHVAAGRRPHAGPAGDSAMSGVLRVLIVDDARLARQELRTLLSALPWVQCVGEADDVPAAREAIATLAPDLVLLDVQMPSGSGFDVLDGLETVPAVVFVTAYDTYAVRAFRPTRWTIW